MRKGFTLVELSIVLVIIGLLIGGILAAQSMIETANITAQIKQFQQLDIAASNFKNIYQQYPGDSDKVAPNGNADGMIYTPGYTGFDNTSPAAFCDDQGYFADEMAGCYVQLQTAGMLPATPIYSVTTGGNDVATKGATINAPASNIGKRTAVYCASHCYLGDSWNTGDAPQSQMNAWVISNVGIGTIGLADVSPSDYQAIKVKYALALEKKMDDGNSMAGNVVSGLTLTDINGTGQYIAVRMLSQTGQQ